MLYMCDSNETLKDLMVKEGFTGTLLEYQKQFAALNPELCAKFPRYKESLPAFMPITLVTVPTLDPATRGVTVSELMRFSLEERQALRKMQQEQRDVPTEIGLTDMMEELQVYAAGFRRWLKHPLVVTPWTEINNGLTDKSLFKLSGETLKFGAEKLSSSAQHNLVDKLYNAMLQRDLLNRQVHMLQDKKVLGAMMQKQELEKQIKELTVQIKQLLPAKLTKVAGKYVHKKFSLEEVRKMRANCYSVKKARAGKILTTDLDVFNRSGLARLKVMIKGMKWLGGAFGKGATLLNYAVVTYDAKEAYHTGGAKSAARAFVTGASAVYLTSQAMAAAGGTAAVGTFAIGAISGDLAAGTALLMCSPVLGWVVVIVAGVTVAGIVGYQAKSFLEGSWDVSEKVGTEAYKEASRVSGLVHEELKSAWNSGSQWVLDFYGQKK